MEGKIEVIKALIKFQGKVPKIELNSEVTVKTKTGGSYKFKFAALPYIVDTIQETLTECQLCIHYELNNEQITLHIIHETGQELTSFMPMKLGSNPQENGSIISYYKRYLLTSGLNLVADEDEDANINVGNKIEKKKEKTTKAPVVINPAKKIDLQIDTTVYQDVLEGMINGYTIKQVKSKYNVTTSVENQLTADIEMAIENAAVKQEFTTK